MIGFATRIRDEDNPFHRARIPSLSINCLPFFNIDPFYYVCFVCRTQNGFVASEATVPAIEEHFIVSSTDPG